MHGDFGKRTISWDPQLWASRNHGTLAAAGAALLAGVAGWRTARR